MMTCQLCAERTRVPKVAWAMMETSATRMPIAGRGRIPRTWRAGNPPDISSISKAADWISIADARDFRRWGQPFGPEGGLWVMADAIWGFISGRLDTS